MFRLTSKSRTSAPAVFRMACIFAAAAASLLCRPMQASAQNAVTAEPLVAVANAPGAKGFSLADDAVPATDKPMHLVFALKTADPNAIQAFVDSQYDPNSANYHHWLTPEQFGQAFGASQSDIEAVADYLQSQGFTISKVWPNRAFISVDADVAHVNAAFRVHIQNYQRPAELMSLGDPPSFYSPDATPTLPAGIASRLNGVIGLSDLVRPHRRPNVLRPVSGALFDPQAIAAPGATPGFTQPLIPSQLSKVYNFDGLHTAGANGTGMKIGIFSPTGRIANDPQTFANLFGLGTLQIEDILVDGGPTDSNGADEAALDAEVIAGQAPRADIRYDEGPNSLTSTVDVYNKMGTDAVSVITSSWSTSEYWLKYYGEQTYITSYSTVVQQLSSEGITMFNDTGDWGAYDPQTETHVTVQMEGASPYVTAVGGTALPTDNNGSWSSEVAWSFDPNFGDGGGGGLSVLFQRPTWQTGPGVKNSFSNGMRQIPDVSALADPNTPGYDIVYNGQQLQVGGTSASTPLWATGTLLIDELARKKLGNINPTLYSLGTSFSASTPFFVYHDITSGNNGVYSCTPNWDYVTGWGSVDFTKLYDDMIQLPNYVPYNPGSGGTGGTWTSPVMIHPVGSTVTEPTQFNSSTTYEFSAAIKDSGLADGVGTTNAIQIDGVSHPFVFGAYSAGGFQSLLGAYFTTLSAGSHTIALVANTGNVSETSQTDNTFTRTITVVNTGPPQIALAVNPGAVVGSLTATGTVTFPATSASPRIVTLSSGTTSAATVPATVTVPANAKTATFTATTYPVQSSVNVSIQATYSGNTTAALLLVNPPPPAVATVTSITPNGTSAGAPATSITVAGTGFVAGSIIYWNSTPLATTYVSATSLKAVIPSSLLTTVTTAQIAVVSPGYQPTSSLPFYVSPAVMSVLSATAVRDTNHLIYVQVTIENIGTARLSSVNITVGSLNNIATTTALPIALGSLASDRSNTFTLVFPATAAASKSSAALVIDGSYTGGAFANGVTVSVP